MDDFRFVKLNAAGKLVALLLILLLASTAPAAALKRSGHTRSAKPVVEPGFYLYGHVCGESDARKGKNFAGSLTAAGPAMQYMNVLAHRQEMPQGQAIALVQSVKKADAAWRKADLAAFLNGYMNGWERITLAMAGQRPGATKTFGAYGMNDPGLQNLRVLGEAVQLYLADHDMTFPRMVSPKITDPFFKAYLIDDKAFYDPRTKAPYQPNLSLENIQLQGYQKSAKTVVYYEKNPEPDGSRGVLFLDGTVAHIPADQWPALTKDSGIPDLP